MRPQTPVFERIRPEVSSVLLFAAIVTSVVPRFWTVGAISFVDLAAFVAMLGAIQVLWQTVVVRATRPFGGIAVSALAVAAFALSLTAEGVQTYLGRETVAAVTAMAAGITVSTRLPVSRLRWFTLAATSVCMLSDRAGAAFAPLLLAALWLLREGPDSRRSRAAEVTIAVATSVLCLVIHRTEPFEAGVALQAVPRIFFGSLLPMVPSLAAGWNSVDAAFLALALAIAAWLSAFHLKLREVAFGITWFLMLALLTPDRGSAAVAGLALATVSLAMLLVRRLPHLRFPVRLVGVFPVTLAVGAVALGIASYLVRPDRTWQPTPNETCFLRYASTIHQHGIEGIHEIHRDFLHDPEQWLCASPSRLGYILPLELAMAITSDESIAAGHQLSLLAAFATLLIVAWMGYRFFGPWVSTAATVLCATLFTENWMARGSQQDGVLGLCGILTVWIVCELMRSPGNRWLHAAFHIVGIWSTLSKHNGAAIYFCGTVWLLVVWLRGKEMKRSLLLGACSLAGVICAGLLYVWLAGGSDVALQTYRLGFQWNQEGWDYQDLCCFGPWTQTPFALFLLNPYTAVAVLAGCVVLALPSAWGNPFTPAQRMAGGICVAMAFWHLALFSFTPKMQILRYVTPGDGAACLVAGIGICGLATMVRRVADQSAFAVATLLLAVGLAGSAARDVSFFENISQHTALRDLGAAQIRMLLGY